METALLWYSNDALKSKTQFLNYFRKIQPKYLFYIADNSGFDNFLEKSVTPGTSKINCLHHGWWLNSFVDTMGGFEITKLKWKRIWFQNAIGNANPNLIWWDIELRAVRTCHKGRKSWNVNSRYVCKQQTYDRISVRLPFIVYPVIIFRRKSCFNLLIERAC